MYITIVKGVVPNVGVFNEFPYDKIKVFFQYTASSIAISTMIIFVYKSLGLIECKKLVNYYTTGMISLIIIGYAFYLLTNDSKSPIVFIIILTLPPGAILWIWMLTKFFKKTDCHLIKIDLSSQQVPLLTALLTQYFQLCM